MGGSPLKQEPVVAKWEYYALANMLVSTHGDAAEAHARERLAASAGDEPAEIVWIGVLTQLERIRSGR